MPLDILLHRDTATGAGLEPVLFHGRPLQRPAPVLFSRARRGRAVPARIGRSAGAGKWLAAGLVVGAVVLIAYMPYTYSGGGGPIGNRYFLGFYPLFLFLMPALRSAWPAVIGLAVGALFTAKILLNPFYSSFNPGEHAKAGPLRVLPIERRSSTICR